MTCRNLGSKYIIPQALALRHCGWRSWHGSDHSVSRRRAASQRLDSLIASVGPKRLADAALLWTGAPSLFSVCSSCMKRYGQPARPHQMCQFLRICSG